MITASSSLIAAGIAALIAYMIAKRNLTHAAEMAAQEREVQREKAAWEREAQLEEQHRAAQRAAYAAYVTAALTALRDLSRLKNRSDSLSEGEAQAVQVAARDSYHALVVSLGRVRLEDRENVTKSANALQKALREFWIAAQLQDSAETKSKAGAEDVEKKAKSAFRSLNEFEEVAYIALQGSRAIAPVRIGKMEEE
ncbi:hypothetical protein KBP30_14330 [Streptomyces sp. Go40/10]|uniref:hypothetical protein n=1 Tax=Streptomyces sp. Go40/10 TaxID=2825844 RepID=UPI001E54BD31|nr:hypothetical protein [Streptomyces sp. Go40/10]UFR02290.1 hypothetical protein KBP30_14330 [Streptomyces sp. Go40/10]